MERNTHTQSFQKAGFAFSPRVPVFSQSDTRLAKRWLFSRRRRALCRARRAGLRGSAPSRARLSLQSTFTHNASMIPKRGESRVSKSAPVRIYAALKLSRDVDEKRLSLSLSLSLCVGEGFEMARVPVRRTRSYSSSRVSCVMVLYSKKDSFPKLASREALAFKLRTLQSLNHRVRRGCYAEARRCVEAVREIAAGLDLALSRL